MTMRWRRMAMTAALLLAGCAGTPQIVLTPEEQYEPETITVPPLTPLVEYPPIEPVEPPLPPLPTAAPAPAPASTAIPVPSALPSPAPAGRAPSEPLTEPPQEEAPAATVPPAAVTAPPVPAAEPSEDLQLIALLVDLQRYAGMSSDDLRRELANATAALARTRTDANRVRLAVLYTLVRATPQDDQRAQQLFENVARSNPGPTPIKQLAAVLQSQVTERQKAVRDEQQKADAAIQKLEALRQMERSLLRDRVRSGGGGGGGGGRGGGGGSGGSGH